MKKVLILILAVILSLSVFAMAACQQPCETHVDGNHDGICDVCEATGLSVTHTDSNHDGKCDGCGGDTQFEHVDAAHDGKCDVCNKTVAVNHVDANNDGYCDVEACGHKYAWVDALADAKEYVDGLYLNASVATTADYTVTTIVSIGGVKYNVAWEIQSEVAGQTSVSLGEVDENKQLTINVDEFSAQEVAYKLVATISDAEGHSVKVEYAREVPEFIVATYEEYLEACAANSTEAIISVRGYVTAINADSGSSSKGSIWIRDAEGHGYYAYKPSLDASVTESRESILAEFPVGTEIVISGTVGNKYGPQHNAGCTIIKTGNTAPAGWNTPVDQTEAFANANGMMDAENLQQYYGSMVTIKGVTMGQIDGYNYYFTINGQQYICYMNIYLMDSAASSATAAKWVVGGKANLTGLVTTYSQKFQIYPYGPECVEIVKEELTDAQIVERAKAALSFDTNHILAASEIELPAEIAGYEVSLAWALDKSYDFAAISEGKLVVSALPAEATTIKLVATIAKGEVSDTLEFEVDVDAAQVGAVTEVNLTVETLGLKSQQYAAGSATVAGVDFEYIELGNYGNGIQMRHKNGVFSKIWNKTALPSTIVSIEITLNADKDVHDNTNVWEFLFGSSADSLTESIKLSTTAGTRTYTITPAAGTHTFFSFEKIMESYSFYVDSIKITLAEVKEEGPLAEGQAYTMSVVQGNLGNKTLYFNGQTREADNLPWYFKTSENVADAAHVFVEVVDGGYKLYFMNGETKTYIRLYERSAGSASLALVTEAPAEVYTFDEEYKTLALTVGNNKYYIGTYNTYDTLSGSSYNYIKTSFPCTFAPVGGTVVPPVEEHTCESKCETCGLCLDAACTEEACANKCQGHEVVDNAPIAGTYILEIYQGNVGKTYYFTGKMSGYYYATSTNKDDAVEITLAKLENGKYTMQLANGQYLAIVASGTHLNAVMQSAVCEWTWKAEIGSFTAMAGSTECFFGTYNTFTTISASKISYASTNFVAKLTAVEAPAHECANICPECGKCTNEDCAESVCAEKCEGHKPAAVVINGQNYSEDQAEAALLALKADDVVRILANATIAQEYTFVAANYTIGEGAVLVAQANMVAPAGTKLTVSANAKLVVEAGVQIDISALTQEDFATSTQARLEIAAGAKVIMPAYTEQLWKDQYLKVVIEAMVADSEVGAQLVLGETKLTKTANGWEAEAPAALEDVVINISNLAESAEVAPESELVAGSGVYLTKAAEGKKFVIDGNDKSIDGFDFTLRFKFYGTMKNESAGITGGLRLEIKGAAKITVYAISGNKTATDRNLVLKDSTFADVQSINVLGDKAYKVEFEVSAAGTYYLGSSNSGMNIYYLAIAYEKAPVVPAHTCESVCEECGKCLDAECTEEACASKCEGHQAVATVVVYNFATSSTKKGTELSATSALALFNASSTSTDLVSVAATKAYDGNGDGGAYPQQGGFIKMGTSKANGKLVLTFAEGKKVAKVEIKCHDWYKKSASHPTNSNKVSVNGGTAILAPYNEAGTPDVLTFDLDGTSNVVTIEANKRVFIFEIVITFAD